MYFFRQTLRHHRPVQLVVSLILSRRQHREWKFRMSNPQIPVGECARLAVSAIYSDGKPGSLPSDLAMIVAPPEAANVQAIGGGVFLVTPIAAPSSFAVTVAGGGLTAGPFGIDALAAAPTLTTLQISVVDMEAISVAPVAPATA
jgi:hypothetical protein